MATKPSINEALQPEPNLKESFKTITFTVLASGQVVSSVDSYMQRLCDKCNVLAEEVWRLCKPLKHTWDPWNVSEQSWRGTPEQYVYYRSIIDGWNRAKVDLSECKVLVRRAWRTDWEKRYPH